MDLNGYRLLLFIELIIDSISIIVAVPSFYNETYNESTLIMPLTDNDTRIPLSLNSSFAKQWCSSIDATLPRITDESDQKNIVQFIRNATRKYQFARGQDILVNNIFHKTRNWTWVNGFIVKQVKARGDGYFFGYLWTGDYRIYDSRPFETRRYICETSAQSNKKRNFSNCEMKLRNRCYSKKDAALTWYKARQTCINEGGDLASFEMYNNTTLKVALIHLGLNESRSYWIGISKSVWRWNNADTDSEIKYSKWKAKHPSNYNAKCLCLNKQPSDYEWIECDCDKSYPFICKRKDVLSDSETATHVLLPSLCCLIIIIIIVAAFFIQKHRNRLVNSSRDVTSETKSAETAKDNPVYAEIENLRENQSPTNCSETSTTYTALQFDAKTKKESLHEHTVYAELDLNPKA